MGRKNRGRPVNGILLLDKDPGCSSNAALQATKRLFGARKAGHTGSLDPLASGMLPLCFGEATKVSGYLLGADKTYWVRARFGLRTATGDAEGEAVEHCHAPLPPADRLRTALESFVGEQEQTPPMYSAIKQQGKRLYELARAGVCVERQPRRIRVDAFELLAVDGHDLDLQLRCSKGTYVRTLVEDLAIALGHCAHVAALRRLTVGPFAEEQMLRLADLEPVAQNRGPQALDSRLLPIDAALADWPEVAVDAASAFYLQRGQPVLVPRAPVSGWVRVCDADRRLMAVGEVLDDGRIAPRRMFVAS